MREKLILFLILLIISCSSILIYKIDQIPKYDEKIYSQVYKEYNQIINSNNNDLTNSQVTSKPIIIYRNDSGSNYKTIGVIEIPKIHISYPIISDCTDENLNIAPTKLAGPVVNTAGNLVIVGHNNWNKEFFSNLDKLENDDIVEITDTLGNKLTYKVYDKYEIQQDDFDCLEQNTDGKIELTLITCIKHQKTKRFVVKCIAA